MTKKGVCELPRKISKYTKRKAVKSISLPSETIPINTTRVYTDGSCNHNGKPNAKAGIGVWFGDNNPLNFSGPLLGYKQSNQTAEMGAALKALEITPSSVKRIQIMTDSEYLINCMTKWRFAWEKNRWKTATGTSVKNLTLITNLIEKMKQREKVLFTYVTAHSGIKGNEEADKLSKIGSKMKQ
jgi:ribonuclease HI